MKEPRFLLSKLACLNQYKKAKSASDVVSYSFKTNKEVGYILRDETDCMFSVHSPASVDLLESPDRIWYFAQGWDEDAIQLILSKGVSRFVVDNLTDLAILIKVLEKSDTKIDLLLRMRLKEHTIHTGKHFVFGLFSDQVKEKIPGLRENSKIRKLGIHFHRKTQNISEWSLKYELESALDEGTLQKLDIINIGGGIPSTYKNFRGDIQDSIFEKIKEFRSWLSRYKIEMVIEPGRFIAAPTIKLETWILSTYDNNIIINTSIFQGAMDTFIAHIRLLVEGEKESGEAYTIKGMTPDSMDIFRYKVFLDPPKVGDKIVFLNAGAYTFSTDFCGLKEISTIVID